MFEFFKRLFKPVLFEVRIKDGKAELIRGKITQAFVKECGEICRQEDLEAIVVYGVNSDYGVRLEFSANTPVSTRQKFRNIWEIHKN